jgi:hypothetical protein
MLAGMKAIRNPLVLLTAIATLAAVAPAAAAGAGPLAYRTSTGVLPAHSHDGTLAPCPIGSEVTGGGGAIRGDVGPTSALVELSPYDASMPPDVPVRDGFLAGAYNGVEVDAKVRARAICLRRGTSRLAPATASTNIPAGQVLGSVAAACEPGSDPVGGGAAIEGPFGGTTTLFTSAPTQVADGDPAADAWSMIARRPLDGFERTISAQAACLDTGARRIAYRAAGTTLSSGEAGTVTVHCPPGHRVSGGGVGGGHLSIRASIPFDGPDKRRVPDDGWRARVANYVIGQQDAIVTAICLK